MRQIDSYILEKLYIGKDYSKNRVVQEILNVTKYTDNKWIKEIVEEWVKDSNVSNVKYTCNYDFKKRKVQFDLTDVNAEYDSEKCKDLEEQIEKEDKDHTLYTITKRKIAGKAIAPKDYCRKSKNILLFVRHNSGNGRFDWQQPEFIVYITKDE